MTDAEKQAMFNRYSSRLMSTGGMRKQYLSWVEEFLDYIAADDIHDEEAMRRRVQGYMKKMQRKHGYQSNSLRLVWSIIRAFFSRNAIPWPFGRGEAPQIKEPEINAPTLDPELVNEMIAAVREKGEQRHKVLLALSSTYGLRRSEIRSLEGAVNLRDKMIYVATLKHGRARSHQIPDQIMPVLKGYDFVPISLSVMTLLWYDIEDMAGVEHYPHVGFHSIRRTLATVLAQHFQSTEVKMFLRWKQKGQEDMLLTYSSTVMIGRGGVSQSMQPKLTDLDRRIFEKHPFLPAWE